MIAILPNELVLAHRIPEPQMTSRFLIAIQLFGLCVAVSVNAEIAIPAVTAYSAPDPQALTFSPENAIAHWKDSSTKIQWHGNLQRTGKLAIKVTLRLPKDTSMQYKMTVAYQTITASALGAGDEDVTTDVGEVDITQAGYHTFSLEATGDRRGDQGNVRALMLDGEPTIESHFNNRDEESSRRLDPRSQCLHSSEPAIQLRSVRTLLRQCGGLCCKPNTARDVGDHTSQSLPTAPLTPTRELR